MDSPDTIIFLHIPKTAGTTLNQVLQRQYHTGEAYFLGPNAQDSVDEYRNLSIQEKKSIRLVAGHTAFGFHRYLPGSSTYFTFLREPIDRVVSFYHYVNNSPQHYLNQAVVNKFSGIAPFVASGITKMVDNGQTRMISGTWLEPPFGAVNAEIFQLAKKNLDQYFSIVGLTDKFDASLLLLQDYFHWHDVHYIPQNVASVTSKDRQLSIQEREVIKQHNQWDTALYALAQDKFKRQISDAGSDFPQKLESFRRSNEQNRVLKTTLLQATQWIKKLSIRTVIKDAFSGQGKIK